jgi:hypothetical protein
LGVVGTDCFIETEKAPKPFVEAFSRHCRALPPSERATAELVVVPTAKECRARRANLSRSPPRSRVVFADVAPERGRVRECPTRRRALRSRIDLLRLVVVRATGRNHDQHDSACSSIPGNHTGDDSSQVGRRAADNARREADISRADQLAADVVRGRGRRHSVASRLEGAV